MSQNTEFFDETQKAIHSVLDAAGAVNEASALDLKLLVQACKDQGVTDNAKLEKAIMQLIDMDVIEYDMDDQNQPHILWLLQEDFST